MNTLWFVILAICGSVVLTRGAENPCPGPGLWSQNDEGSFPSNLKHTHELSGEAVSLRILDCCQSGTWLSASTLDVMSSVAAGASAYILLSYHVPNMVSCLHECCTNAHGNCTAAAFADKHPLNCIHYYCSPMESCIKSSDSDTGIFFVDKSFNQLHSQELPGTSSGMPPRQTVQKPSPVVNLIRRSSSDSVPEPSRPNSPVVEVSPLKRDNTRVKARKGVPDQPHQSSGDVNAGQGVRENMTVVLPDLSAGIENISMTESSLAINATKTISGSQTTENESTIPSTILLATTVKPHSPQHTSHTSVTEDFLQASTTTEISAFSPTSSKTGMPNSTDEKAWSSTVAAVFMTRTSSKSAETTVSPVYHLSLQTSQVSATGMPKDWHISNPDRATLTIKSNGSLLANVVTEGTVGGQVKTISDNDMKLAADSNTDLEYRPSSMYLVAALALGLLLLFVVIGIIGRRIYVVWQYRHYHRMDFLIEGMYHSAR